MDVSSLLLLSIALPLLGAIFIGLVAPGDRGSIRTVAFVISLMTFGCVVAVVSQFPTGSEMFATKSITWLPASTGIECQISVGLDGLSLWLYGLSGLLMLTAILVSWTAISERPALFYSMLLLLESGCLGVFAAQDLMLFYVFFEFTLIPLFFLIGIWGSEDRRYAAIKFFLFTLAGSLLTFVGLITLVVSVYNMSDSADRILTFSIPKLTDALALRPLDAKLQIWLFAALFAGFAIKVPLFPLHTWLPLAHVQAPTAGSVILAGVLLKIGTYGFLRFSIPMLPAATEFWTPWLLWLSVIGIIYGALVALVQSDIKKLIAYSSVSHLGFCMLGLFALNRLGVQGATLQMINHGISTGGLFALVGMLYERYHTRQISSYSGLAKKLPVLTFFMLIFTFSSIGLPGMNGFAGEIMILTGMFQKAWHGAEAVGGLKIVSVLAVSGVVLGAWYMLWLVQRVFFGPLVEPHDTHDHGSHAVHDLSFREIAALVPLCIFVFWIGLYPKFFLDRMAPTLDKSIPSAVANSSDLNESVAFAASKDRSLD
ncbi:MAG: NADH-quinone oxidoreductase subunit M [Planctomycetales bacterium]|nr:NADH-quinone oxidoreductase subunit M [Planctomycetales bacterium]